MKSRLTITVLTIALVIGSTTAAGWAQRARAPVDRIDQINRAVTRAQQRAAQSQDRVSRIPDQVNRAERAQDRLGRLPEQAERGIRASEQAGSRAPDSARSARSRSRSFVEQGRELARMHPRLLEFTRAGAAVRGQLIAIDPGQADLEALERAGFVASADERMEGLDLRTVTFRVPAGLSVDEAQARAARLAPGLELTANHIHLQTGAAPEVQDESLALAKGRVSGKPVGLIDGGVAEHPLIGSRIEQRGFVTGGAAPSGHATAVASLLIGTGRLRGVLEDGGLLVADIYGRDPRGGNALALARALGWLVSRGSDVIAIPLAGPSNPLVARATAAAQRRGALIVAPVGNGGPAAPPSYPASYKDVIAVTGVDRRRRALIEAGRSPELDYAAPGADILAAAAGGSMRPVRGTSFAVPFVVGRLAQARQAGTQPIAALNREAVDLGRPGADPVFGRGLVCGDCGTRR